MKRSGDDCNCETQTRGDVGDTGVILNELGSRIQGIADSHDFTPTLRLLQEMMRIQQNQQIISFHKRIHRLIQHRKRSQSSKQHTLCREISILFSRSSVHLTTNDILHFHNVEGSDTPIPHLIQTIEMNSLLNQWNQQRYYRDAEGSTMYKHHRFQMIIEKRKNPNESSQLHSQVSYKQ